MKSTIPHVPTDETKKMVRDLSANGIPEQGVSEVLGIDQKTLRKYYAQEIREERFIRVMKVGNALYKSALSGDTTAAIFYLKTQGRWRTEDNKVFQENDEQIKKEILELRAELDKKYRKDY